MEDKTAQEEKHYNIQNLRPPWKKGESGNPAGRPKNRVLEALKTLKTKKELREHFNMSARELDEWEQLLLTLSRPELTRLGIFPSSLSDPKKGARRGPFVSLSLIVLCFLSHILYIYACARELSTSP